MRHYRIDFTEIAEKIKNIIIHNMQAGIIKQIGVDGNIFYPLNPKTIKQKRRKGYSAPTKRMYATGDFVANAYGNNIKNNGQRIEIFLKNQQHKNSKATYKEIGQYNNGDMSRHFGISTETWNKLQTAFFLYIDKKVDNVFDELEKEWKK